MPCPEMSDLCMPALVRRHLCRSGSAIWLLCAALSTVGASGVGDMRLQALAFQMRVTGQSGLCPNQPCAYTLRAHES